MEGMKGKILRGIDAAEEWENTEVQDSIPQPMRTGPEKTPLSRVASVADGFNILVVATVRTCTSEMKTWVTSKYSSGTQD